MENMTGIMERLALVELTVSVYHNRIAHNPNGIFDKILKEIEERLKKVREKIEGAISDKIGWVASFFEKVPKAISEIVDTIESTYESTIDTIWTKINDWFEQVSGTFRTSLNSIVSAFETGINTIANKIDGIQDKFSTAIDGIIDGITDWVSETIDKLKAGISSLVRGIETRWETLLDTFQTFYRRLEANVKAAWETATTKVTDALRGTWERIVEIYEKVHGVLERLVNNIEGVVIPFWKEVSQETGANAPRHFEAIGNLIRGTVEGDETRIRSGIDDLLKVTSYKDLGGFFLGLGVAVTIFPASIGAIGAPAIEAIRQEASKRLPVALLNLDMLSTAYYRGLVGRDEVIEQATRQGISADKTDIVLEANRPLPTPGQVQEAYLRGFIGEDVHDTLLHKHGYTDDEINLFKALYFIIPGPADLIRMAVKEAFSPEIAEKFGQYQDFPTVFAEWAEKQGLSREWAERYWAAHWELPSPQMGFEMLHREVINENELKMLLRALDVMPFWREKLIQISYSPYTRVDVRRMYRLGILDKKGVYKAYKDLGYNDEKATNLTEFTIRYYTPEDKTELDEYRELTRSVYTNAYKKGVISRDEFIGYLKAMNYSDDDAEFLAQLADTELLVSEEREDTIPMRTQARNMFLDGYKRGVLDEIALRDDLETLGYNENEIDWYVALSDYEVTHDLKALEIEKAHQLYLQRAYSKSDANVYLSALNLRGEEISRLLGRWDIEREVRTRMPTEAQFRAALSQGIIAIEDYVDALKGLGYADKYVEMLAELAVKRGR